MKTIFLSIGSNIEDRKEYLKKAIGFLIASNHFFNLIISSIYETEAVDYINQCKFLNLVVRAETELEAMNLLQLCQKVEQILGRQKRPKWHEREIDIDIIFYDASIVNNKNLIIPHPRMHLRKFVLVPMNEIDDKFLHPVLGLSISEILKTCQDESEVKFFDKLET